MVILGIDPGLNATGYGIIETASGTLRAVTAGEIRTQRCQPLAERLDRIHQAVSRLIGQYHPAAVAIEAVFTHHTYVSTAALMAHARGVICLAVQEHGVPLAEYPTARVKKSLTGSGAASKEQVARMVEQWLRASDPSWSSDATDALALAIAHAHAIRFQDRQRPEETVPGTKGTRYERA